jgi:hypothetical protein
MNLIQEFEYRFEYNRILIYKVLDFVFSFNKTIQNSKTLSAQETLTFDMQNMQQSFKEFVIILAKELL